MLLSSLAVNNQDIFKRTFRKTKLQILPIDLIYIKTKIKKLLCFNEIDWKLSIDWVSIYTFVAPLVYFL